MQCKYVFAYFAEVIYHHNIFPKLLGGKTFGNINVCKDDKISSPVHTQIKVSMTREKRNIKK